MNKELVDRIKNDPDFATLTAARSRFAWILTIIMLVVYFAFILTIAFDPSILGTPLSEGGITTVGIPVGITVIIIAFALTGVYVRRANTEFDELTNRIKEKAKEE